MFKKMLHQLRVSDTEYRASLAGLHSFCGTVLGVALVGTEQLSNREFYLIMCGLLVIVIAILNISTSNRRIAYTALALLGTLAFPRFAEGITGRADALSDKIFVALILWACTTASVEFLSHPFRAGTVSPKDVRESLLGLLLLLALAAILALLAVFGLGHLFHPQQTLG